MDSPWPLTDNQCVVWLRGEHGHLVEIRADGCLASTCLDMRAPTLAEAKCGFCGGWKVLPKDERNAILEAHNALRWQQLRGHGGNEEGLDSRRNHR